MLCDFLDCENNGNCFLVNENQVTRERTAFSFCKEKHVRIMQLFHDTYTNIEEKIIPVILHPRSNSIQCMRSKNRGESKTLHAQIQEILLYRSRFEEQLKPTHIEYGHALWISHLHFIRELLEHNMLSKL